VTALRIATSAQRLCGPLIDQSTTLVQERLVRPWT
jgi:hypothetical protein